MAERIVRAALLLILVIVSAGYLARGIARTDHCVAAGDACTLKGASK